ncbi:MAG: TIGR03905 family TSCPD domain-containing protein [Candidatus Adiutrix sp.]|jgi:uncharacterized protein (TIGR03905 family)|nr:TIGR03905 family TSCPD domain-containing protein [Candidatus Adiutrix sp.]
MKHTYSPKKVCSTHIEFEIDGDVVHDIHFEKGCDGNLQGLARLAEGRNIAEVVELLAGIKCGRRATSCPDQLAKALKKYLPRKTQKKIQ